MKRILIGVAAVMLVAVMSGPVLAGSQTDAVIALHLQTHLQKGDPCTVDPATQGTACSDYVLQGDLLTSYDLYLMVAQGNPVPGVGAISCGIVYNDGGCGATTLDDAFGVDVFSWQLCTSGLDFPNGCLPGVENEWPASGGGNRITWDVSLDCRTTGPGTDGVQACAGVFYVYAYDQDYFQITPNNNLVSGIPELQVGDCNNAVSNLLVTQTGFVWFSTGATEQGCNPCLTDCIPIAVENTTWGQIKRRY
mgnify:CR=1 FL=1